MENNNILEVKNMHTYFFTDNGTIKSVDGVDMELKKGSTLGIVGESGSGKSVTALSVMGLLMGTTGKVVEGEILLEGKDLLKCSDEERREMRGQVIYPAAVMKTTKNEEAAKAFLKYLTEDTANKVFEGVGFTPIV